MAKWINDAAMDAALNYIKNNVNRYGAMSAQSLGAGLATKTIADTDFTGPADGTVSGRKLTINEQADVSVTASGDATHVALYRYSLAFTEFYYTTCTTLSLVSGGLVTFPAWKIEIADPT